MNAVDLRSNIDVVYNQSSTNACGPHAVVAALDAMHDHAGHPKRFSRYHLWWWVRMWAGLPGQNVGSTFETLERALRINGTLTEAECPWDKPPATVPQFGEPGYRLVRTQLGTDAVAAIKRLLCMGVPVVWCMRVTQALYDLASSRNWRTHHLPPDNIHTMGMHYVCIVGYDDAADRFLVENSWGPEWADGGFFGLSYASLLPLNEGLQHIDIGPINPKPVEGYTVPIPVMLTADRAAFAERAGPALLNHLMGVFASSGVPGLIAECKTWGVSDKHLEAMAGWPRGSVRAFKAENPALAWDGFIWDQL